MKKPTVALLLLFTALAVHPSCAFSNRPLILDTTYHRVAPSCDLSKPPTTVVSLSKFIRNAQFNQPLVIPCGHLVQVDHKFHGFFTAGVYVYGHINFLDGGAIKFATTFIIVRGLLTIGTKKHHHNGRLLIELVHSVRTLRIRNEAPINGFDDAMIDFGRKAFVVYGGRVEIYAQAIGHSYAFLDATVEAGATSILVDRPVGYHWRTGDQIAISSSSSASNGDAASLATVYFAVRHINGSTTILLSAPLQNKHIVRHVALSDGSRRVVKLAPVVTRLSRNVVVRGISIIDKTDEWFRDGRHDFHGGHFVVTQSAERQVLHGVEFVGMGQAGKQGRYPIHFHFNGRMPAGSVVSRNSVHHSKQRCIVVHATHGLLIDRNVAFQTAGHCFVTEDGLETGNRFSFNVGTSIVRALKLIVNGNIRDAQSDDRPAVFWMAAPGNHLIGNIAAGSEGAGFWYELHHRVRGESRDARLPGWREQEVNTVPFGKFAENTAHSVGVGLATYPMGSNPSKPAIFEDFTAWSVNVGWHTPVGSNQHLIRSVMVDVHSRGINANNVEGHSVQNVTIVGELENKWNCRSMLVHKGVEGIHLESGQPMNAWYAGMRGIILKNVHLQALDTVRNCGRNVGIVLKVSKSDTWFPPASVFSGVTFDEVDEPLKLEVSVKHHNQLGLLYDNVGIPGLTGSGYLLSLPTMKSGIVRPGCAPLRDPLAGVAACEGQCWRHVSIAYINARNHKSIPRLQLVSRTGQTYVESPSPSLRMLGATSIPWVVSMLLPAGTYRLSMLTAYSKPLPVDAFDKWSFFFIRSDAKSGSPSCAQDVELLVHGQYVPEAQ